jgi:hypothetical protein
MGCATGAVRTKAYYHAAGNMLAPVAISEPLDYLLHCRQF